MGCETNLSIAGLSVIAKGHGYKAMIAVGVRDDGTVDVVSYGRTKEDCRVIGDYAQNQFGQHLPFVPFTSWFGWGNDGVPLAVASGSYDGMSAAAKAYTDANTHPDAEVI